MPIDARGAAPLLFVFDMRTSLEFYRRLGFRVVMDSGQGDDSGWVLLDLNGCEIMLNTAYDDDERPPQPDPARVAAHQDTSIFFGCANIDEAAEELRAKGVPVRGPAITGYGFKSMNVTDPDNYELVFHWPESEEARADWRRRYGMGEM